MMMRVKMLRPIQKHRCSIGCSRQHRANAFPALLCLARIGNNKTLKPFVFHRLKKDEQPKPSVITWITVREMSASSPPSQKRDLVFSRLGKINEVQSSIPSRMKRVFTLDVKVDDSLKVMRRVLVLTGHGAKASSKERTKEVEQASSNRAIIQGANDLPCTSQEVGDFPWENAGLAPK